MQSSTWASADEVTVNARRSDWIFPSGRFTHVPLNSTDSHLPRENLTTQG